MNQKKIHFKNQSGGNSFEFSEQTSSALLIPEELLQIFNKLCQNKTRAEILHFLLLRYRSFILLNQMESSKRVKTKYQNKGQNLKRISFKPDNRDWTELGILASGLGSSRTLIFSIFLELELRGLPDFFEIPVVKKEVSHFSKYQANTIWRLTKKELGFQRILWYLRP